jgi:hypothetical protein
MTIPSKMWQKLCYPDRCRLRQSRLPFTGPVDPWRIADSSTATRIRRRPRGRENVLFCQRTVQKVEPILPPQRPVAVDAGGRLEDQAIDRSPDQRLVAVENLPASRRDTG